MIFFYYELKSKIKKFCVYVCVGGGGGEGLE